ncbi:hypothetical protein DF185_06660 [Marinifilum breve]|uniref:Uncharacterized protein n=1 Tax=Marinifilum breve TaxID=2184082 RepID=A0A2V4AE31_9BACT|nr:hypothetical protein [Marinifilum breve]PXY02324.1 hypothetical protein DF185_06660 [Marinifilum breve]
MESKNSRNLKVCEIILEEEALRFCFLDNDKQKKEVAVNAGRKYVSERFFKGDVPKDDEVEISIYHVEESVIGNEELLNRGEHFVFKQKLLPDIFDKKVGETISFDEVEKVNHKFFDVIAGVPESVIQIDFSKEKFTVLMILRAIMHVLKIRQIEIAC